MRQGMKKDSVKKGLKAKDGEELTVALKGPKRPRQKSRSILACYTVDSLCFVRISFI